MVLIGKLEGKGIMRWPS